MLFDLRGKRKRFIQIVYGLLAGLFLISFVGFGIGSDAAGGIFDALGIGGSGNSGTSNPQFEQQIDEAEEKLEANPKDEQAWLDLARTHFQAAQNEFEQDDAGNLVITDTAQTELEDAAAAWQSYLELDPNKPEGGVAVLLTSVYQALIQSAAQSDPQVLPGLIEDAEGTARIAAEREPSQNTYFAWAQYAYWAGDEGAAEKASKKLLAEVDPDQRKAVQRQLDQLEKTGEQIDEFVKSTAPGKEELTNPLLGESPSGGLGGTP